MHASVAILLFPIQTSRLHWHQALGESPRPCYVPYLIRNQVIVAFAGDTVHQILVSYARAFCGTVSLRLFFLPPP
jgi:hypothetical protein